MSSSSGAIAVISQICLALLVFNSYPLLFMEYKKNTVRLIQDMMSDESDGNRNDSVQERSEIDYEFEKESNKPTHTQTQQLSKCTKFIIALICHIAVFGMGAGYPHVGVLLGFVGATAANIIAYIMPSAVYLKICTEGRMRGLAGFTLAFGIVCMIIGLTGEIGILVTT